MAEASKRFVLAIDIGGTFTDLVLLDSDSGELMAEKILTTYPDPSTAVLDGVGRLLGQWQVEPEKVGRAIHGTTLVTNALIERKGGKIGLLTTAGFRDALEIGREGRYDIYDLFLQQPRPLVERRLRREVAERLDARGEILSPLDAAGLLRECEILKSAGVEAVAIVFLHSYVNPVHEQRALEMVQEKMPGIAVSASHQVAPEFREYERTSTTVANAYVQPLASRYLQRLEKGLAASGIGAPLHIMLSNGGTCSASTAAEFPVRLVESGPSGGALAASYWGHLAGKEEILAFDMGGTTAKAVISTGGQFPLASESEVARVYRFKRGSGLPLLVPVMDMIEIGAGGGSIAHLNELGLPSVGPESAGAEPGPACYGLGGEQATVTDADLVLGLLNPDYFLGGKMQLDQAAGRAACAGLGRALDMNAERMAWGIHQLVDENMANAARVHAAERGLDIRAYALVATGGAGPVHACGLAQRLGLDTVVVPAAAGVGSAFGLILAPISFDFVRTFVVRLAELQVAGLRRLVEEMEREGRRIVAAAGVAHKDMVIERSADMRYVGQGHEIRAAVANNQLAENDILENLQDAFEKEYRRLYGRLCDGVEVEAVHWRVTVSGPRPQPGRVRVLQGVDKENRVALKGSRPVIFDAAAGACDVPVYDRYVLEPEFALEGPAIIEEAESTTVVRPGWACSVGEASALVLKRQA